MKYALSLNDKIEATPEAKGTCPCCGSDMVAKCGTQKVRHWAHKGKRVCDHWWENETEWHRNWKDKFPKEWQEVVHFADDGEKHIADVKTSNGLVIEFQHSYITPEEIAARESFYEKMIWIVDGTRLVRDLQKLSRIANSDWFQLEKRFVIKNADRVLPKNWLNNSAPVYFDIGHPGSLICLTKDNACYKFPREYFTEQFKSRDAKYGEQFFTKYPANLFISSLEVKLEKVRTELSRYVVRKRGGKFSRINDLTRQLNFDELVYLRKLNDARAMDITSSIEELKK